MCTMTRQRHRSKTGWAKKEPEVPGKADYVPSAVVVVGDVLARASGCEEVRSSECVFLRNIRFSSRASTASSFRSVSSWVPLALLRQRRYSKPVCRELVS